jgi:hypothetical protein
MTTNFYDDISPFFSNDGRGAQFVHFNYKGNEYESSINTSKNTDSIIGEPLFQLMVANNYVSKTPDQNINDIHQDFVDFIVKIALSHRNLDKPSTKEVDWLPGGIVLTKKKNFQFLKDYNLDGKAYTEDIINSYYRNKAGIKQLVVLNSKVFTDQINKSSNKITKKFFSEKINEYKARLFYTKLVNGNIILFNVWWLIYLFNSIFKKIKCR